MHRDQLLLVINAFVSALLVFGIGPGANAQTWPAKPVRIVVPFPPGGPSDTLARVLAQPLTKAFNQQFVIDNRAGAGGNVGAEVVAKAAPDGYTLFLSPPGPQANNQFLYKKIAFDPKKDFTPIVAVSDMPLVFAVHPRIPARTIAELIEYARKNPGKLSYASPGNGTIGHLAAEFFKQMTTTDIVHVPYRGSAPALQDLLGGSVDLAIDNLPPYLPFIRKGQIRALAVTTEKRWSALKDVPTMQEAGVAPFQASSWIGLFGPARLPHDIVESINRQLNAYLASEEGAARLLELGYQPLGGTPEDLEKVVRADVLRWGPVIEKIGIRLD